MQWKALDTDSDYEVSDTGLVRKNGEIVPQYNDKDGYQMIIFKKPDGKRTTRRVHRLVLHAFSPCENEAELEVHHIDENIKNNNLDNLMWVTHEENIRFIDSSKLKSSTQFIARPVSQLTKSGEIVGTFPSAYAAAKATKLNHRHISEVCQGKRLTHGGFRWKYFEGSTTKCSDKCCETGDP